MSANADLSALTGVRSGKRSYYQAYVRSDERLRRSMRAMDSISQAVVRAGEGPHDLVEEVVRAAADHLSASWTVLALADGALPDARPRFLALDQRGELITDPDRVPFGVRSFLSERDRRTVMVGRRLQAAMTLEGREVGWLVGIHGMPDEPDPADLLVLRILANQAAVALHTFQQYRDGMALERRAQHLYDEACAHEQRLAQRTVELRRLEERLAIADQRELINNERHRIARELHDSVIQYVLSAGMTIEVARGDVTDLASNNGAPAAIAESLHSAKQLCQDAVKQLRSAIYALHLDTDTELTSRLPDLIAKLVPNHEPRLPVEVVVEGQPVSLPVDAHHEIVQAVGEALFNVVCHASAERAVVTVRYGPTELTVEVDDDGEGDPDVMGDLLRRSREASIGGRRRGLVNIESRIVDLGGCVAFQPSPLGGVRVEMRVPVPLPDRPHNAVISGLACGGGHDR